jgi:cytochrome c
MVAGLVGHTLVHPKPLKQTVLKIEGVEVAAGPVADPPIAALLANADVGKGQALMASAGCVACHSFDKGGKNGVGPNLYGVVGAPHGHTEGFAYSSALKGKAGNWTYDDLYAWLKKPAAFAPGTKMSYAGMADPNKRADMILYLWTLSDNPGALPEPPAAPVVAAPVAAAGPIAERLAKANAKDGEAAFLQLGCIACHTFNEGGRAGLGPNLYNVVGGPKGHMAGFAYSPGMKAKEGPWTYDALDEWLTKPSAYIAGTKMSFAGIPDPNKRASVILYLRSLSAAPVPLPN